MLSHRESEQEVDRTGNQALCQCCLRRSESAYERCEIVVHSPAHTGAGDECPRFPTGSAFRRRENDATREHEAAGQHRTAVEMLAKERPRQ